VRQISLSPRTPTESGGAHRCGRSALWRPVRATTGSACEGRIVSYAARCSTDPITPEGPSPIGDSVSEVPRGLPRNALPRENEGS
jgi:hypothetical protein